MLKDPHLTPTLWLYGSLALDCRACVVVVVLHVGWLQGAVLTDERRLPDPPVCIFIM